MREFAYAVTDNPDSVPHDGGHGFIAPDGSRVAWREDAARFRNVDDALAFAKKHKGGVVKVLCHGVFENPSDVEEWDG